MCGIVHDPNQNIDDKSPATIQLYTYPRVYKLL